MVAAVGGGAFSALASDSLGSAPGVSVPSALFGGLLLLLGARLGAGCTRSAPTCTIASRNELVVLAGRFNKLLVHYFNLISSICNQNYI